MAKKIPSRVDLRSGFSSADKWMKSGTWILVKSSNVKMILYDLPAQKLYVEFLNHSRYWYSVPPATARKMFNSGSMGKFVWSMRRANIKGVKVR